MAKGSLLRGSTNVKIAVINLIPKTDIIVTSSMAITNAETSRTTNAISTASSVVKKATWLKTAKPKLADALRHLPLAESTQLKTLKTLKTKTSTTPLMKISMKNSTEYSQ